MSQSKVYQTKYGFPSRLLFCFASYSVSLLNWILASFITFLIFSLSCHSYISGPKLVHATYWITHMKNQSWLVFPWPPPIPRGLATVYSTNGRPSKVQNYQSSHHHTPPKKKKNKLSLLPVFTFIYFFQNVLLFPN